MQVTAACCFFDSVSAGSGGGSVSLGDFDAGTFGWRRAAPVSDNDDVDGFVCRTDAAVAAVVVAVVVVAAEGAEGAEGSVVAALRDARGDRVMMGVSARLMDLRPERG